MHSLAEVALSDTLSTLTRSPNLRAGAALLGMTFIYDAIRHRKPQFIEMWARHGQELLSKAL